MFGFGRPAKGSRRLAGRVTSPVLTLTSNWYDLMQFTPLGIRDAFLVEPSPIVDDRGFFAVMWSPGEFARHGLTSSLEQASLSQNKLKGTVRGMHFQVEPHAEAKLVRCQVGAIFDVILDLRRDSATYKKWVGVELSAENRNMLSIPEGCAHGFQTLTDGAEVFYLLSKAYAPAAARGVRWDDPAFDIRWPGPIVSISERDRIHPNWK
jgi:dTDP-4-dehydrorhamnose 3,5-epimerase